MDIYPPFTWRRT